MPSNMSIFTLKNTYDSQLNGRVTPLQACSIILLVSQHIEPPKMTNCLLKATVPRKHFVQRWAFVGHFVYSGGASLQNSVNTSESSSSPCTGLEQDILQQHSISWQGMNFRVLRQEVKHFPQFGSMLLLSQSRPMKTCPGTRPSTTLSVISLD